MTDERKSKILLVLSLVVMALSVTYNVLVEYGAGDVTDYLQRRLYYERVISKRGLDLHRGMHWKEKE